MTTLREVRGSDADRLESAFRRCVSRKPTAGESSALLALLEKQNRRFESGGANPWDLITGPSMPRPTLPEGSSPAKVAAWTAVSRVLLNLDETITKE